ncbi:Ulp1 protease family [Vigna unguiculata]|uniref:Ulp1 protease family n=1 Tax=Vigna unguiculata TaxID=3917 RepID=A0A4D6LX19_VIGUN|nr:Ulp1 protease family [Vigna unguiculata]
MTELREEILSRSYVGDEEDGENVDEKGAEGLHKEADVEVEVEQRDQEDEIGERLHKGFDLNSESDVEQFGEVLALQVIAPYDPQQPSFDSLGVDLMKLYHTVTYARTLYRLVANINGQILGTSKCSGFAPGKMVDNMVVLFGASTMMYFQRRKYGHVKRVAFNPLYASHVLNDSRRMKINRRQWTLKDYEAYFRAGLISVEDIVDADFLFAPMVHEGHWWCYAVNCQQKKLYVLDSIGHSNKNRKRVDNAIAYNMGLLFGMLLKCGDEYLIFEAECQNTPIQPNLYDCGIIVLQMMELWDGQKKFDGNTMPDYTNHSPPLEGDILF